MPKLNTMYDIDKLCKTKQECADVQYLKVATGGNDPRMSKAMRYSQYVNTKGSKLVMQTNPVAPSPSSDYPFPQIIIRSYGPGYLAQKPDII